MTSTLVHTRGSQSATQDTTYLLMKANVVLLVKKRDKQKLFYIHVLFPKKTNQCPKIVYRHAKTVFNSSCFLCNPLVDVYMLYIFFIMTFYNINTYNKIYGKSETSGMGETGLFDHNTSGIVSFNTTSNIQNNLFN